MSECEVGRGRFPGFRLLLAGAVVVLAGCGDAGTDAEMTMVDPGPETYMVGDIEVRTDGNLGAEAPFRVDQRTLELQPGPDGGMEFKYRLEEGATMVYSWEASGPVRVEMHSEADDQPEGTAEFFDVQESATSSHGTFTAPFPGIHGWYWENQGDAPVTLTIRSSGYFTYGVEFPGGQTYQLSDVVEAEAARSAGE